MTAAPVSLPHAELRERLLKLVSLDAPENGGPYGGYAASKCIDAMREAASALASDAAQIATLERERDEAIAAFDKLAEPAMKSLQFENGEFNMALTGPAVEHMSAAFVGHFKAGGGKNYIEMSLFDREEPYQRYVVTVQKVGAKSPHELRAEAESTLAAVKAENDRLTRLNVELTNNFNTLLLDNSRWEYRTKIAESSCALLREALTPFANSPYATLSQASAQDSMLICDGITVGDLRKARAALAGGSDGAE